MASTYSSLLRVELIGTGDQSGSWGNTTNTNLGTLVEQSIAGTASINVTSGNVTLSANDGSSDQARCMILNVTGTPGTSRNIVAPSSSKVYILINGSDDDVVLKGAATTGITFATTEVGVVVWDGSDFAIVAKAPPPGDLVTTAGTQTLTNKTLTSPRVGTSLLDTNGNELLKVTATGSAVNELTVANAATNNSPVLSASGNDTNIGITLTPKGTGIVSSSTTFSDQYGKVRAVPQSGSDKTTSYTLTTSDVGQFIGVGSGGSVTIPDATFSTGDVISVFNNTTGEITITCTITTAHIAGANADVASVALATRGVCTILFISGTVCVITGNVS
jgi:hypothetical protein